ncbi:MAG: LamG-like jellyroll fold domain-containing protein [Planctomycetota bacterium]
MSVLTDEMVKVGYEGGMKMLSKPMNVALALALIVLTSIYADMTRAQVVEEGLVSYWTFDRDDIEGNTVKDLRGNNDGTMSGNPIIVQGKIGDALEFDGDDHVDCGRDNSLLLGDTDLSFGLWVKFTNLAGNNYLVGNYSAQNGKYYHIWEQDGRLIWSIDDDVTKSQIEFPNIVAGEWYHAFGVRVKGIETRLYVNGVLGVSGPDQTGDITSDAPMYFGDRFAGERDFEGIIDEVALYNRALSDDEVFQNFEARGFSSALIPADAASDVPRDIILSWEKGVFAATYDVYFGTNFNAVNTADATNPMAVLVSPGQDANTFDPGRLAFGQTYYWRVDEVNGPPDFTVHKGDVWSFTVEPIAYPIAGENINASASSSAVAKGPENTVNGSGLDESGLLHGKEGDDNMWLSDIAGPQPSWIEFQFDKVYKLHEMWVWNANETLEPVLGLGFKDVTIEYSIDGTDYVTLGTTHEFARAPGTPDYEHNTTVDFGGVTAKHVRLTANSNWGGLLPQYGLSEVRFFHIPLRARQPSPDSGATDVDVDVTLSFRAGREAAQHDVYLSTDEQAVIDGTAPVTTVTEASYGPLSLDLAQTYYWKVNEVNMAETPTMLEGDLWNLTTREFLVVDDFGSYNDLDPTDPESRRIFNVWIDGYGIATNGSLVGYENPPFCERAIVHSGNQSMPFFYNNAGSAAYSEAELPLSPPQNWTEGGAATFVLYFHGTEGNTGQLYVKVNGTKVIYGGDAGDTAKPQWNQWNIDLASVGTNLQNVTKLSIGIDGNGASGTLYVDDIRLYASAPEPEAP